MSDKTTMSAQNTAEQRLAAVTRQRDTLLAELERIARAAGNDDPKAHPYDEIDPAAVKRAFRVAKRIRAAIAKATEKS